MLAHTRIALEACNSLANRMRRWSVEIGQDLLGMWLVEFGRIGSKDRRSRHAFVDEPAAEGCVHSTLAAHCLVSRAGIEMAAVGTLVA